MPSTPSWALAPFALYLLVLALAPALFHGFWQSNRNRLIVALAVSVPVVVYLLGAEGTRQLAHAAFDYASFMALLGALFTISSGIGLRGRLVGSTRVNCTLLAAGALLANLIGTTGASVLLIRPLLRANAQRRSLAHLVVFFIFIVSNTAGLLTPLGDPPLLLGFLRGVPFTWTLRLWPAWALVNGTLLLLFALTDLVVDGREKRRPHPAAPPRPAAADDGQLRLEGGMNLLWLLALVGLVFALGTRLFGEGVARASVQVGGPTLLAAASWWTTPRRVRDANLHSWAPILEVAIVFAGVFVTMIPALALLSERGARLGIVTPTQFFWASGLLSSVLDNAPTYLAFASLATSVANGGTGDRLGELAAHPTGQHLLAAISCGSVMMGALTYLGNGPNFMVKAIAEQHGVRMPGFFRYTLGSCATLLPLFAVVAAVFF